MLRGHSLIPSGTETSFSEHCTNTWVRSSPFSSWSWDHLGFSHTAEGWDELHNPTWKLDYRCRESREGNETNPYIGKYVLLSTHSQNPDQDFVAFMHYRLPFNQHQLNVRKQIIMMSKLITLFYPIIESVNYRLTDNWLNYRQARI